jgi:tripartite-type tricarboxylate transporter receptor subunit TctC
MWARRFACMTLVLAGLALPSASPGWADAYPSHALRLVVPFEAGGGNDIIARQIAKNLAERLHQGVIVDNRGGAGGIIGTELVARAAPDGYTLLYGQVGPLAIAPSIHKTLPYDPFKDFAPVMLIGAQPTLLVVNPQLPVNSVGDLIALAKARPGQLNFSSAGEGSMGHLSGELFKIYTGAPIVHVPYRSGAQAITDVMGGYVQMTFNVVPGVLSGVKAGKLKALAATAHLQALPDVPTMAAAGVPAFDAMTWCAILLPARTPAEVVNRLNQDLQAMVEAPAFREQMTQQNVQILGGSPADVTAYLQKETARWAEVVKTAGIHAN